VGNVSSRTHIDNSYADTLKKGVFIVVLLVGGGEEVL